jgi:hypothetical protein
MDIVKNASENLSVVKGEADESVHQVAGNVKKNSGFPTFPSVCQVLNGDNVGPPEDATSEKIPLLKYAQVMCIQKQWLCHKTVNKGCLQN